MPKYSIEFIESLAQSCCNISLPNHILNTIFELSELVGDPEYNKTPEFMNEKRHRKKTDNLIIPSEFLEKTKLVKKQGINREIDIIRNFLNKLTDKNQDIMINNIKEKLLEIKNNYEVSDQISLIKILFNIIFSNKIYAELYSNLLKNIWEYELVKEIYNEELDKFINFYLDICKTNDLENYDKINLINKNKGCASLYCFLLKQNLVYKEDFIVNIYKKINLILENSSVENQKENIDDLSDIIFILVSNSYDFIKNQEKWEEILNNIIYISNMTSSNRVSISNKSIFKFMDLKEIIN